MENIVNVSLFWLIFLYIETNEAAKFNKKKFQSWILIMIILLPYLLQFGQITVSLSFIIMVLLSVNLLLNKSLKDQFLLIRDSFLLGLIVSSVQLFLLYEYNGSSPFLLYGIIFTTIIIYMETFVSKQEYYYSVIIVGIVVSEILKLIAFSKLQFPYSVGENSLFLFLFVLVCFSFRKQYFMIQQKRNGLI